MRHLSAQSTRTNSTCIPRDAVQRVDDSGDARRIPILHADTSKHVAAHAARQSLSLSFSLFVFIEKEKLHTEERTQNTAHVWRF